MNREMSVHEYLKVAAKDGKKVLQCIKCGREICEATEDYKSHSKMRERPLTEALYFVLDPHTYVDDVVVLREFYCPGCFTLLDTEVARQADPVRWRMRLA